MATHVYCDVRDNYSHWIHNTIVLKKQGFTSKCVELITFMFKVWVHKTIVLTCSVISETKPKKIQVFKIKKKMKFFQVQNIFVPKSKKKKKVVANCLKHIMNRKKKCKFFSREMAVAAILDFRLCHKTIGIFSNTCRIAGQNFGTIQQSLLQLWNRNENKKNPRWLP